MNDEQVEREVLAYLITSEKFFQPLSPDLYEYALPRKVQTVLNAFFREWGQAPQMDALTHYPGADVEVMLFLTEVSSLRLSDSGFRPAVQALFDMYRRRKILAQATAMVEHLKKNTSGDRIVQEAMDAISSWKHPLSFGEIERAESADMARMIWEEYEKREANPELYNDGIRFGIYDLDRLTNGGTRKGHITLIYGDTSSGKTRLKSNIAYNMALLGKRVLYVTIEDSARMIVRWWLSRAALMNFNDIQNASLSPPDRETFRQVCDRIYQERNLPYVVYWTGVATSADLRREVDLYANKFHYLPDVVFFDYSNEAFPIRPFNNTSERFNYLFSEYRQMTSQYQLALATSLQESRTGKQKKKETDYGLDSIGQSHYVAPHCHLIVYIKQNGDTELDLYVQKNRYGMRNKKIVLGAFWNVGFIGDRGRLIKHEDMAEVLRINAAPPEMLSAGNQEVPADSTARADHPINAPDSSAEDADVDNTIGGELDEESYSTPEA